MCLLGHKCCPGKNQIPKFVEKLSILSEAEKVLFINQFAKEIFLTLDMFFLSLAPCSDFLKK